MDLLIAGTLIVSNISHNEFALVNTVLREYDNLKKQIKNCFNSSSIISIYL